MFWLTVPHFISKLHRISWDKQMYLTDRTAVCKVLLFIDFSVKLWKKIKEVVL